MGWVGGGGGWTAQAAALAGGPAPPPPVTPRPPGQPDPAPPTLSAYELLRAGAYLTDDERDVLRWGRNAKVTVPKRFGSAGPHADKYRAATAVECLVGYLYLTDARRLHALMAYLGLGGEGAGGAGEAGEGGGRVEGGGGEGGAANAGPAGALPA